MLSPRTAGKEGDSVVGSSRQAFSPLITEEVKRDLEAERTETEEARSRMEAVRRETGGGLHGHFLFTNFLCSSFH